MKKFVFVLMPFRDDFTDVYQLGIQAACQSAGMYCERVDEQYYEGSMLERIYNQIQKADYIIADMTTKNPNVFYEVGYAHALDKRVVLITQEETDIPFDMKHYKHIIYSKSSITLLRDKLYDRMRWYLEKSETTHENEESIPDIFINGSMLRENETVEIDVEYRQRYSDYDVQLDIALLNSTDKCIDLLHRRLVVEHPLNTVFSGGETIIRQERRITKLSYVGELLPDDFREVGGRFYVKVNKQWLKENSIELKLILIGPNSSHVYLIKMHCANILED